MQLVISGRHTHLSDTEKQVFADKLEKYDKKVQGLTKADVIVNVEHDRHDVEVILHVAHSNPLVAKSTATTNYAALDLVIGKLDNIVSKMNSKAHNKNKNNPEF